MEISNEKSKILINGDVCKTNIILYREQIDNVKNFKYIGSMLTENGTSMADIRIRLATATAVMVS